MESTETVTIEAVGPLALRATVVNDDGRVRVYNAGIYHNARREWDRIDEFGDRVFVAHASPLEQQIEEALAAWAASAGRTIPANPVRTDTCKFCDQPAVDDAWMVVLYDGIGGGTTGCFYPVCVTHARMDSIPAPGSRPGSGVAYHAWRVGAR